MDSAGNLASRFSHSGCSRRSRAVTGGHRRSHTVTYGSTGSILSINLLLDLILVVALGLRIAQLALSETYEVPLHAVITVTYRYLPLPTVAYRYVPSSP